MEKTHLLQLIGNLKSADNDIRNAAEAEYDNLVCANGVWIMCSLAEVCAATEDQSTVMMGLILLRKLFNRKENFFGLADAETQATVKSQMLQVLGSAAFGPQRSSAAACVSALTVKMNSMEQEWGELWENIFQILESAESQHQLKTMCCEIISTIGPSMTEFFTKHIDRIVSVIHQLLFNPSDDTKRAAFDCVINIACEQSVKKLSQLVPFMLQVVQERLNAGDWENSEILTAKIAEGVTNFPALFQGSTVALLEGMMQVAATPSVEEGARHMAIETMVSYCESEPKTVRKVPNFSVSLFELLFNYTLNPSFDDDWDNKGCHDDDVEESSDQVIGSAALDRLATALGGRKLETVAQRLFLDNIRSSDWKHRSAALLLITYVTEGMVKVLEKHLGHIVGAVLPALRDEVKYVRANALDCLTQLSNDFAPMIQEKLHQSIVPAVVDALKDPVPAVATRAARCLDSFFNNCEDDEGEDSVDVKDFERYVHDVCVTVVTMLRQTSLQFVREDCLGALSSVISTCKGQLTPFVNDLVPVFQEVLSYPDSPDGMLMKCKAIECTTLLACGVGKENFILYAHDVCSYLRNLLSSGLKNEDIRLRYVLRGWTCMVECLKVDVLPYMDVVMPVLISMMDLDCDTVIEDAEVGEESDDDNDDDNNVETCRVIIPGKGVKKFKFRTSLIEDKDLAASVVTAIVTDLGSLLGPHLPLIAASAIRLLDFVADSSIRESGALILDGVLAAYEGMPEQQAQLAVHALPFLLERFEEEMDLDVSSAFSEVISRCIDIAPSAVTQDTVWTTSEKVLGALKNALERRVKCMKGQQEPDVDEDDVDKLQEECDEAEALIRDTCDLIDKLVERAGTVFAPVFIGNFFPILETWMNPQESDFMVTRGLAVLCGFVEYTPDHIEQFLPIITQHAVSFAGSRKDPDLLQSAYYLINVLLQSFAKQNRQSSFQSFVAQVLHVLQNYVATTESKESEYADCTCNVISAMVTLVNSFHAMLSEPELSGLLSCLVGHLPVGGDEVEACRVHERVLHWVTQGHPALQGIINNTAAEIVQRLKSADRCALNEPTQKQLESM